MKIFKNKKIYILGGIILLFTFILVYNFYFENNTEAKEEIVLNTATKEVKSTKVNTFFVDVKGSVKKPGVYKMNENDRVIDAINIAGGLSKSANTSNINLSQKLKSEMVIYVYNDTEIKEKNNKLSCDTVCQDNVIEVNNCIQDTNDLVNINTATIEELITLDGIGASKAQSIIEYRKNNGGFKSIEELKNVSGIGESVYLKIKDKITI